MENDKPKAVAAHRGAWVATTLLDFPPCFARPRHSHLEFCAQTVLGGVFSEGGWSGATRFSDGQTLLRPGGFEHFNDSSGRRALVLSIRMTGPTPHQAINEAVCRSEPAHTSDPRLAAIADAIRRELMFGDDLSAVAIETSTIEYLVQLLRLCRRAASGGQERHLAERCARLIEARLSRPVSVDHLAQELGVTRFTLNRAFQRAHGIGVSEYVRGVRVRHACRQITQTNQPLAAIAAASGFADQSHMTRSFRQILGTTPHRLRGAAPAARDMHENPTTLG